MKFYPNMYQKDIHSINYKKLKKLGIKCLVYDLDNTIALIDQHTISDETKKLILDLKKDFIVVIISNNITKRVKGYADSLECDFVANAIKPFSKGYRKIEKKYNLKPNEMCMIGDQILTDIYGGNKFGMFTVFVDPLGKKDLKITSLNRFIENRILKKYKEKDIMKKGVYYE
jgi:HAD superfamily phosphatase (TIGR01668 family)